MVPAGRRGPRHRPRLTPPPPECIPCAAALGRAAGNREVYVPTPAAVVSVALGPEVRKFVDVKVYIDNDAQTVSIYQGDDDREIATAPLAQTLIEWYLPSAPPGPTLVDESRF